MKLKYIGVLVLGIVIAFLFFFVNPSNVNFFPKCPLYVTTGLYCPGCGSQRATHQLLHLNILGVLQQNILYLLGVLLIGYHLIVTSLNLFFKKHIYNYMYHPKTPIIILIIVVVFWILRNIPYYPFTLLAPN
ncbi:hypothetical protein Lupro_03420 [Lutibacter profundi]|uniref:DUF2752 domain-containing protein n=1 Tax=Lutibacter profundi TaxID=1622118 RepID=A0A109RNG5_9FLAO|nr:DUF2752 domain-containing protein [Lutibacter profundi]AMC10357.1 hypothetical protein Lupro_03420 [Lutibacter profundi]